MPRVSGIEILRISQKAIDFGRVFGAGIPILDSHQQVGLSNALGVVRAAWIEGGALIGRLSFNATDEGRKAEGMVARSEITGLSVGYRVVAWEITDKDGRKIDPKVDRLSWSDNDLIFEASKWELLEVSLCSVPADASTGI